MKKIANFILEKFDGSTFDFYKFTKDGFALLLFFRGAWCNLCKKQLLDFQAHFRDFDELKIKIVGIAPDSKFKLSLMKTFLKIEFPILADEDFKVVDSLNLRAEHKGKQTSKPAIFMINSDYEIIYQYVGEDYNDRLSAKKVLEEVSNKAILSQK